MTIGDDIVRLLRENPEGLSDAELATRLGKLHQQIYQRCNQLARVGHVRRDSSFGPIRNVLTFMPPPNQSVLKHASTRDDPRWEGNVQDTIIGHLCGAGWTIVRAADTASLERGIDIIAERVGRHLLIEVRGCLGTTYAGGDKAGQPKPTSPTLQAKHWLSNALLKTVRTRGQLPDVHGAIGLPNMPRYRSLLSEIAGSLAALKMQVLLVHDDRTVTEWKATNAAA